jgi:glycine/serine hydroxymethyltransferase
MGPDEFRTIGALIARTLRSREDDEDLGRIRAEVRELCAAFPPYPALGGA